MKRSPLPRSAGSSSATPQASGSTNQNGVGTCFSQKEIKIIRETILRTSCGPLSWRLSFPLRADVLVGAAWLVEAHLSYDPGHISPPHFAEGWPGSSGHRRTELWLVDVKEKPGEQAGNSDFCWLRPFKRPISSHAVLPSPSSYRVFTLEDIGVGSPGI